MLVDKALRAPAARFPSRPLSSSTSAPAAAARSWCCWRPRSELSDTDRALVEVFCSRLSVAFDNVHALRAAGARPTLRLEERVARAHRDSSLAPMSGWSTQCERLQRANAFKNEVLGTVAHDLKNPLGVILGRTEMLNELLPADGVAEKARRDQIEHIRQSARRLTAMVDDLIADAMSDALDISVRARAGRSRRLVAEVVGGNRLASGKEQRSHVGRRSRSLVTRRSRTGCARRSTTSSATPSNTARPGARSTITARREGDEAVIRVARQRPGPVAGGPGPPVRPFPAAFGQADRRRELDRPRASRSPNASSTCTAAASSRKVPAPGGARFSLIAAAR